MEHVTHDDIPPVYDENSKILILGSIPSIASRKSGFYYAHPKNRFWKILEILYQEKISDKKEFCLKHHIALWDTVSSCDIHASSDATIKNVIPNNLSIIFDNASIIQVFTAGKKAHEIYQKYLYPIYKRDDICLMSTSSAYAQATLEDLVLNYQIILNYLN